jgi:endonuclease-3 related protein
METNKIYQIYLDLAKKHGSSEKFWPQWCKAKKSVNLREKIAIGAILTQRTTWHNASLALANLKKTGLLSLRKIANLTDLVKLTDLIRSAGFYQSKPKRLFELCSFITKQYGNLGNFSKEDLKTAREKLLSLNGIGPETADTILLYAMDKLTFVIDEYTKRLVKRKGLITSLAYDYLKSLFEENLPLDVKLYQDFHTLIIIEEKGKVGSMMRRM